ncbi:MAG: metalloregulator ArsR/SmtB family transcription factor [Candidatus Brocadiia bacterium]|jgi:DNA-binding transcriptional ArsR family regulator
MKEFMAVTKALADDNRTRALMCLRDGELCVCQIIELLQLAPSTVSKHLNILHRAGLLESRKEGRWIYYRLAGPDAPEAAREALRWVRQSLAKDPQIARDAARLKAIRKMDVRQLCERYRS